MEPDVKRALGRNVRCWRRTRGMSTEELAARAGILESDLKTIESGKANPTLTTLEKLAKALQVTFRIY